MSIAAFMQGESSCFSRTSRSLLTSSGNAAAGNPPDRSLRAGWTVLHLLASDESTQGIQGAFEDASAP